MTVLHSELTGTDLHGAKVLTGVPNRNPLYAGETLFDGQVLWVATGTTQASWKPCLPTNPFSWVAKTSGYQIQENSSVTKATLYYYDCFQIDADYNASSFEVLHSWSVGIDWRVRCPINFTNYIQSKGTGCYVFLLTGNDAYGTADQLAKNQTLQVDSALPSDAIESFTFSTDFTGLNGVQYSSVVGFEINEPLAQVLISVINSTS